MLYFATPRKRLECNGEPLEIFVFPNHVLTGAANWPLLLMLCCVLGKSIAITLNAIPVESFVNKKNKKAFKSISWHG